MVIIYAVNISAREHKHSQMLNLLSKEDTKASILYCYRYSCWIYIMGTFRSDSSYFNLASSAPALIPLQYQR